VVVGKEVPQAEAEQFGGFLHQGLAGGGLWLPDFLQEFLVALLRFLLFGWIGFVLGFGEGGHGGDTRCEDARPEDARPKTGGMPSARRFEGS
jgi:hypothetical protein